MLNNTHCRHAFCLSIQQLDIYCPKIFLTVINNARYLKVFCVDVCFHFSWVFPGVELQGHMATSFNCGRQRCTVFLSVTPFYPPPINVRVEVSLPHPTISSAWFLFPLSAHPFLFLCMIYTLMETEDFKYYIVVTLAFWPHPNSCYCYFCLLGHWSMIFRKILIYLVGIVGLSCGLDVIWNSDQGPDLAPCIRVWSPGHWTAREGPVWIILVTPPPPTPFPLPELKPLSLIVREEPLLLNEVPARSEADLNPNT